VLDAQFVEEAGMLTLSLPVENPDVPPPRSEAGGWPVGLRPAEVGRDVAFLGGVNLGDSRRDDREHLPDEAHHVTNPLLRSKYWMCGRASVPESSRSSWSLTPAAP
jgi:hypothetical protein